MCLEKLRRRASKRREQARVENFFGPYFNQDWNLDAESVDGILDQYVSHGGATDSDRASLIRAIREFAERDVSDRELADLLYRELGCEYLSSADNLSTRAWLTLVATKLESYSTRQSGKGGAGHDETAP